MTQIYERLRYTRSMTVTSSIPISSQDYVGPGNVIAGAVNWWGIRGYSSGSIGRLAVRLRRDSDNAEADFNVISKGGLDATAIAAFAGGANLFVSVLYDQVGGVHLSQPTTTKQPQFTPNSIGVKPTLFWNDANSPSLFATLPGTINQPFTVSWVALNIFHGVFNAIFITASITAAGCPAGGNSIYALAPTEVDVLNIPDGVYHAVQTVFNGAASDSNIDGVSNVMNIGTNAASGMFSYSDDQFGNHWNGNSTEIGIWPFAFTSAQSATMNINQRSYWGY